jgi:ribosomal protein S18 acetylase RimI-like enzyme
MSGRHVEIITCPAPLTLDALALALADLTPQQRRDYVTVRPGEMIEGLVVALDDNQLLGASWGQRQPGSTAILWPPQLIDGHDPALAARLACRVAAELDASDIRMAQVLLHERHAPPAAALESAGFNWLADLLYLSCEAVASSATSAATLEFEPYTESQYARLAAVVERTYEATQDCAQLGGRRPMDEVLGGYRATGEFRPENWQFVRSEGEDVGVLLLADHRAAKHWELMYMGLVPSARGRKLGCDVVRHAQRLASAARAERIVLAVDAENIPAIKMYNETGFILWDRRTVFVRFAGDDSENQKAS